MGIGRVAEPKVRDVGCASSFNDPVKESIWFETWSLRTAQMSTLPERRKRDA